MKTRILAWCALACALALPSLAPGQEKTPYEEAVDVFVAGKGNPYKSIRIPCIICPDGKTLVAAAEGRYVATDQGKNDIIVSISKNGGKTWSAPVVAAKANGATFNNPYLIYDKDTKEYILFFQSYPPGVRERGDIPAGSSDPKTLRNFVCFSKNAKNWSKPKDVTATTKHEDCTITCSGPNPGVQISRGAHQGRLVVVFNEAVKFGKWHLTAAYSDDHGKTWNLGEKSQDDMGVNEVSVVETEAGGIFVVSRNHGGPGGGVKRVAYSEDAGETWSSVTAHSQLPCVGCQNGLTRYSFAIDETRGGKSRILFSGPAGPGRQNGVIKLSYDEGLTWNVSKSVGKGSFMYSTLCPMEGGNVGLLFEKSDKVISFTHFSLEWLTDGDDDYFSASSGSTAKGKKEKKRKGAKSDSE